jgi:hypothetical protein
MPERKDENDAALEDSSNVESKGENNSEDESSEDETGAETKRFERSDNLRRRADWFQKRTGGR